jgi:hypothetical protein
MARNQNTPGIVRITDIFIDVGTFALLKLQLLFNKKKRLYNNLNALGQYGYYTYLWA